MITFLTRDFITTALPGRRLRSAVSDYNYSLRVVVARWMAKVKEESIGNIVANDSWFKRGKIPLRVPDGDGGYKYRMSKVAVRLAPYYRNARYKKPKDGVVTSRTGALVAGLKEGGVDENSWTGLKAKIAAYESKSITGKIKGKPSDTDAITGTFSGWSRHNDSDAMRTYKEAFAYWKLPTPGEKAGDANLDKKNMRFHFMHEVRGRPYMAKTGAAKMEELESNLVKATEDFVQRWALKKRGGA